MNTDIIQEIRRLTHDNFEPIYRDDFHRIFAAAMVALDLPDRVVAAYFETMVPTIQRWRNGANAPHPLFRRQVLVWLMYGLALQDNARNG